jgi:nucleoside 2-deoxyribosyltransferase
LHSFHLPHESETIPFTRSLLENKEMDIVLAEVSYPSTGEGIEMGWAHVFNIPIYCIYKEGMKYSGAINTITNNIYTYKNTNDMIEKIKIITDIHA